MSYAYCCYPVNQCVCSGLFWCQYIEPFFFLNVHFLEGTGILFFLVKFHGCWCFCELTKWVVSLSPQCLLQPSASYSDDSEKEYKKSKKRKHRSPSRHRSSSPPPPPPKHRSPGRRGSTCEPGEVSVEEGELSEDELEKKRMILLKQLQEENW